MKKILLSIVLLSLGFWPLKLEAQNSSDSITCLKQISIYRQLYKMGYTQEAYSKWQTTYNKYNNNKIRLLSDGEKYLNEKLKSAPKNINNKKELDSLLDIYSQKGILLNNNNFYQFKKAIALYNYGKYNQQYLLNIIQIIQSLDTTDTEIPKQIVLVYFYTNKILYKSYDYSSNHFYSIFFDILEYTEHKSLKSTKNKIINEFCLLKKQDWNEFFNQLNQTKDFQSQVKLILTISNKYITIYPQKITPAKIWLNQLSEKNKNQIEKNELANLHFSISTSYFAQDSLQQAKSEIDKAIQLNPSDGKFYYLLGNIYSNAAKTNTHELSGAIYCLAADKFEKALILNPSLKDSVENRINWLKKNYPQKEEAFFKGYSENAKYQFKNWINDTTILRFRNI